MIKIYIVGLLVLINCSSIPKKQLLQVENVPKEKVNETIVSVLNSGMSKSFEKNVKSEIDINDKVLKIEELKINNNTNYEVYKVKTEVGKEYSLELYSKCDCFGFTKTMMLPLVITADVKGNLIKSFLEVYEERDVTWALPLHLYYKWKITATDNLLYIIVGADNSYVGEKILKNVYLPVSVSLAAINIGLSRALLMTNYPFFASPFGKYEMTFNEYNDKEKNNNRIKIKAIN